ncbi:MAG: antitoxin, partial [Alphaproteobacteria bacterium]
SKLKRVITIRLDGDVVDYFKDLSEQLDIPYQTLLNDFLRYCKDKKLVPKTTWKKIS